MAAEVSANDGITGRLRNASVSILNASPQLGMWQATGTAIAQAPNLTELRQPESGGANIEFDAHGHSARTAVEGHNGELFLVNSAPRSPIETVPEEPASCETRPPPLPRLTSLAVQLHSETKETWSVTIRNGLKAFWKFFLTLFQVVLCYFMWAYNRLNRPVGFTFKFAFKKSSLTVLDVGDRNFHRLGLRCFHVRGLDVVVGRTQSEENRGGESPN